MPPVLPASLPFPADPGDVVLAIGCAAPGLVPESQRERLDSLWLELEERRFPRYGACFASLSAMQATWVAPQAPRGVLCLDPFAQEEVAEALAPALPLAVISVLPRSYLAVLGLADRTHLLAAVALGRVR